MGGTEGHDHDHDHDHDHSHDHGHDHGEGHGHGHDHGHDHGEGHGHGTTTAMTTAKATATTMAKAWILGPWWPRATTTWGPLWGGSRRSRPRRTPTNRPRSTGDGRPRGLEARQARDRSRAKRAPLRPGPRPTPRRLQFSSTARPRQI